jgi:hypothetical protein
LCCVSATGFSANNKHKIVYPHLNSSWWECASYRASREWTGILRTNGMWSQYFTWSHSALFVWSVCPRGEDFRTNMI